MIEDVSAYVETGRKTKYGIKWPSSADDIFIDLICAKKWREEPFCHGSLLDPWEHLLKACRALFTPEEFKLSRWTEEHAHDFTTESFCITWGPAASGKSNDFGCFVVLDWITDPLDTFTIMASTTADMLQYRSFESASRYFKILKRNTRFLIPGKESRHRLAIINDDDAEGTETTLKASIKGVAVHKGTVEEARTNLQGVHLPYVRLILDELSGMREAAMDARTNLSLGTRDFRLFGLCNPDNKNDLAGRFSVPVDGWESVSVDSGFWRTQWGAVRHHDGFKSPAVTERGGAEKYPYLINQKSIDTILREYSGNADAPAVWTMIRGWPPPQGSFSSILTEQLISAFRMAEKPLWLQQYMLIAGLDPAFTSDGDNAILQLAALGLTTDHVLTLGFMDAYKLIIEASSKRPVTYQLLDQVLKLQSELGFSFENLGVDDSGTQSVADIIDAETGCRTFRVNFLNKATDMPVSVVNDIPANKLYANRITEYYFAVSEFGQKNQIRGLPSEAAYEFCQRRLADNKMPRRLERKRDLKLRIKRSPDYADAGAICVGVAREKFGMLAGAVALPQGTFMPMSADDGFDESLLREFDIDGRRNNYQKSGF